MVCPACQAWQVGYKLFQGKNQLHVCTGLWILEMLLFHLPNGWSWQRLMQWHYNNTIAVRCQHSECNISKITLSDTCSETLTIYFINSMTKGMQSSQWILIRWSANCHVGDWWFYLPQVYCSTEFSPCSQVNSGTLKEFTVGVLLLVCHTLITYLKNGNRPDTQYVTLDALA